MKLTEKSQQRPPMPLLWHDNPDDREAVTRVYGRDLVPEYDYPAYAVSTTGALIQDPQHASLEYAPYKIQFEILCDKLSELSVTHHLNNTQNAKALGEFRLNLLCGYHGNTNSKYAQQDKLTFKEIKYNLELILNHIIKNADTKTLKDVIEVTAVCEGGVYIEFNRLKESLTVSNGLLEFLQKVRVGFVEAIAQKHIADSKDENAPIIVNNHSHVSILVHHLLHLMGKSLPALPVRDNYIPTLKQDPNDPSKIQFDSPAAERNAREVYNLSLTRMMRFTEAFDSMNTAENMIKALADHLYEKVSQLYTAYSQAKDEMEIKLNDGQEISESSRMQPGISLREGIDTLFKTFMVNHLTTDLILEFDEYDFEHPMYLKSQERLRYYLYAGACFALFNQDMINECEYAELHDNYELSITRSHCWVSRVEGQFNLIQPLESLPADIVKKILRLGYVDVHFVRKLRNAHIGNVSLHKFICSFYRKMKRNHNLALIENGGTDYIIESEHDIKLLQEKVSLLPFENSIKMFKLLVQNNRADVLSIMPMNNYGLGLIQPALRKAILLGYNEVGHVLVPFYNPVNGYGIALTIAYAFACNARPLAMHLLVVKDCTRFINAPVTDHNETLLMQAVKRGNIDDVEILLQSGANVDLIDKKGRSAFSLTRDNAILTLLVKYSRDAKKLSARWPALFYANGVVSTDLIQAYIQQGGAIVVDAAPPIAPYFLIDPAELISYQLIDNPENLRPIERQLLIDYIVRDFDALKDYISADFMRRLIFAQVNHAEKPYKQAEKLVEILKSKGFSIKRKIMYKCSDLHDISDFFGFSQLCALGNIELGSDPALRLYAKVYISRYTAKGESNSAVLAAFNAVIKSKDGRVAQALSTALDLTRPRYTRIFSFIPYFQSDLPVEISNRLRA